MCFLITSCALSMHAPKMCAFVTDFPKFNQNIPKIRDFSFQGSTQKHNEITTQTRIHPADQQQKPVRSVAYTAQQSFVWHSKSCVRNLILFHTQREGSLELLMWFAGCFLTDVRWMLWCVIIALIFMCSLRKRHSNPWGLYAKHMPSIHEYMYVYISVHLFHNHNITEIRSFTSINPQFFFFFDFGLETGDFICFKNLL